MIKFNALEEIIEQEIKTYRQQERWLLLKGTLYSGLAKSVGIFLPMITMLISFYQYSIFYGELSIGNTFAIILLFKNIIHPLGVMHYAYKLGADATASS